MEQIVQFRDYQEQVADDHNNIQKFTRASIDGLVGDTVTWGKLYAGLAVQKTGQVEITVGIGRVYDGGAVFGKRASSTHSMASYTAAAARRIVVVAAYGNEVQTDQQERDYVVDVATRAVEPRSTSMTASRDVQVVLHSGAEAVEPVAPAIPASQVAVAYVLMDTTQVVSIQMVTTNQVMPSSYLDTRARSLEQFRDQINPRVSSLASDLASLGNTVKKGVTNETLGRLFLDVARLKSALKFPDDASGIGSWPFLDRSKADYTNIQNLGWDAKVEMGVRFPDANLAEYPLQLFAANDPNAMIRDGILLPAFTEEVKIQTGEFTSDLGIGQYGFQTFTTKIGYMSRSRIRHGASYTACSNGVEFNYPDQPVGDINLYDWGTTQIDAVTQIVYDPQDPAHEAYWRNTWWFDTWKEPFSYTITQDSVINGACVAQTLLISNDIWATKLGFYLSAKAADEDIHFVITEVTNGVPDILKGMTKITIPHSSLVIGWNDVSIKPTFMQKGKRLGVMLVSAANHKIGMTSGQNYLDGSFFWSTDRIYYQGDLSKDMMLRVYGASFNAPQVTVELAGLSLDGGMRDIDILTESWAPSSTQLVWELRPSGSGEWKALGPDAPDILAQAPPFCQFRLRFIGTRDMMPAVNLQSGRVRVSRPKTAFKFVSTPVEMPRTSTIIAKVTLEMFDEVPHDFDLALWVLAGPSGTIPRSEASDVAVTKILDASENVKRVERTFTFNTEAPVDIVNFVMFGTTTFAPNTFHVAYLDFYTL